MTRSGHVFVELLPPDAFLALIDSRFSRRGFLSPFDRPPSSSTGHQKNVDSAEYPWHRPIQVHFRLFPGRDRESGRGCSSAFDPRAGLYRRRLREEGGRFYHRHTPFQVTGQA